MQPKGFPEPALDPIASHRAGNGPRNREPETWAGRRTIAVPLQTECRKQRRGDAETFVIDQAEIGGAKNPDRSGKTAFPAAKRVWRI